MKSPPFGSTKGWAHSVAKIVGNRRRINVSTQLPRFLPLLSLAFSRRAGLIERKHLARAQRLVEYFNFIQCSLEK